MASSVSAAVSSRAGSARSSLDTAAMGSGSFWVTLVKSVGLIPAQAERIVRLAAWGWCPVDIRDRVDWEI